MAAFSTQAAKTTCATHSLSNRSRARLGSWTAPVPAHLNIAHRMQRVRAAKAKHSTPPCVTCSTELYGDQAYRRIIEQQSCGSTLSKGIIHVSLHPPRFGGRALARVFGRVCRQLVLHRAKRQRQRCRDLPART